jgi:adenine-specific DNA-methyltransferase
MPEITTKYTQHARATLFTGDRLGLLKQIPDGVARLVVTSPPYNIGKRYEKKLALQDYLLGQRETLREAVRVLADDGSLCWQVGNHIAGPAEIVPIDVMLIPICIELGLKLRNRIIWHFEHGLHAKQRFSGRYETIIWFTKSNRYVFNLDRVRVPQKYPGKKAFKGPKRGQYTANPLGKNPGDLWIIPNVKHNHPEKTDHPCQFPIELVQRLVLALTNDADLVVDPYMGVGSALCAAVLMGRRAAGADISTKYVEIARRRVAQAIDGSLKWRAMDKPIYKPDPRTSVARKPMMVSEKVLPLFSA